MNSGRDNRHSEPQDGNICLCGADGSPYSNKVKALLTFRRIPFRWMGMSSVEALKLENPPGPPLLPKLVWPDGSAMNDSTFIIKELEARYQGRSVVPVHKGLAFLSSLFEDFCDEWVTKAMYHYRWTHDIEDASYYIGVSQAGFEGGMESIKRFQGFVGERQVGRKSVVGSNNVTGKIIERSFEELCAALGRHFEAGHGFLLGTRPSAADFALYGQLHPMISLDPNTSQKVFAASRAVWFWYHTMKDLSGLSLVDPTAGWLDPSAPSATLKPIFKEMGRFYAPFILANAAAITTGAKQLECDLDGGAVRWEQPSFKYQAKCLRWLREDYAQLSMEDKQFVDGVLAGTGCAAMFEASVPSSKL